MTASPATAALSAAQRDHLAERLLAERARTLRSLNRARRRDDDGEAPTNHYSNDPTEGASDTIEDTLRGVVASRETWTLGEIDRALRRLYRQPEHFGRDELTGEPIPFERLDIIPWARRAA